MNHALPQAIHSLDLPALGNSMRSLLPSDVSAMLDLFRRASLPAQLARSIYAAAGAQAYLGFLADHSDLQKNDHLWGLKDPGGRLLAAAHTRTFPASSHLNWFAVDPDIQGRNLGTLMMAHWERLAKSEGVSLLTLDVADINTSAKRLYLRNGFEVSGTTHEFRYRGPRPAALAEGLVLLNWPFAQASYATFGFGRFQVGLDGRQNPVDVDLTSTAFRTTIADERILALATRLDPGREILFRTQDRDQGDSWEFTGSIDRMWKQP